MNFPRLRTTLASTLILHTAACGGVTAPDVDAPPAPASEVPVNTTSSGTLDENGLLSLATHLVTTDTDTAETNLVYTLRSLPTSGAVELDGTPLTIGSTFTQADVTAGRIAYRQNGGESPTDSFTWTLSDGSNTVPSNGVATFSISVTPINDLPVIVNNPLTTIVEGATDALPMTRLLVTDAENDGPLVFTFVSATHGTLEKRVPPAAFMPLAANATFTDQDLAAGNVRFVDSGVDDAQLKLGQNTTASFSWRVQDGDGGFNPSPTTANVSNYTVTPVDDPPSIAWRTSACHQANVAIAANPVISLSDTDNNNSDYSICVVSIGNGSSIVFMTTTQTIGTTVTVTPTLKNGTAVLGVNSCVPATALGGLTMTSTANQDGGSVTWKLVKNATQVGLTNVMSFVKSSPPC